VTTLFATFLGYNPIAHLLGGHALAALPPAQAAILTGHGFFPRLITKPFSSALGAAFTFAVITCVLAAAASLLRGGKHDWTDRDVASLTPAAVDGQPAASNGPPLDGARTRIAPPHEDPVAGDRHASGLEPQRD
jgi:hypothetical protein